MLAQPIVHCADTIALFVHRTIIIFNAGKGLFKAKAARIDPIDNSAIRWKGSQ
jgi:hypothetical protein